MKPLLGKTISQFQAPYVPNRHIHDNVVIAHELLVDTMKRKKGKSGYMGLKLDMSKAFDGLSGLFC